MRLRSRSRRKLGNLFRAIGSFNSPQDMVNFWCQRR